MFRLSFLTLILASFCAYAAPEAKPTGSITTSTSSEIPLSYKFNALLQAWTINNNQSAAANNLNFRLRRAELKFSGTAASSVRYFVMADPAKTINPQKTDSDGKILQDLGVGFTILPGLEITAGQFKILTSAEGLSSSAALIIPERSLTSRTFGDKRDTGAMLAYQGRGYRLAAMASNGAGTNLNSVNTNKDLSARADVDVTKFVTTGIYGQIGDFDYDKKGSWGVNARVSPLRDLSLGAEYDQGRQNRLGVYGVVFDVTYLVTPQLQPVLRHEFFQQAGAALTAQQTSLGVNYLVLKNTAKIQGALSVLTNMTGGIDGSPKYQAGANGPMATVSFQASI